MFKATRRVILYHRRCWFSGGIVRDNGGTTKLGNAQSVLVVHPKVRWGSGSASVLKNANRQLEEAVALVNNLPNMRTVESLIMPVDYNTKRKSIWATGNLEKLVERMQKSRATSLMVNVDILSPMQQEELYRIFEVPIYDRYNIVLSIFKEFAETEEARIQIALAELPYAKNRVHALSSKRVHANPGVLHIDSAYAQGDGVDVNEYFRKREQELKKELSTIMERNNEITQKSSSVYDAVVAIVGYTNVGKTSLVKKLTGAASLEPKDRLFATLDTTRHFAKLPSGRSVLFTDTIGFLSDLPVHLISAFEATLSHVKLADVIIHMRDVSNPDWKAQEEDVIGTLRNIGVDEQLLSKRMVTVDNKIDKAHDCQPYEDNINNVRISCQTGHGMEELITVIDKKVIEATRCKTVRFSLDVRSPAVEYLYRNNFVVVEPKVNENTLIFDVVMNETEIARFRKRFSNLRKKE